MGSCPINFPRIWNKVSTKVSTYVVVPAAVIFQLVFQRHYRSALGRFHGKRHIQRACHRLTIKGNQPFSTGFPVNRVHCMTHSVDLSAKRRKNYVNISVCYVLLIFLYLFLALSHRLRQRGQTLEIYLSYMDIRTQRSL